MQGAHALLVTHGLTKRYGKKYALDKADLSVREGEIYGLIGRNGAGKTTLLKLVNSQIRSTSGEILLGGKRLRFGQPSILIGSLVETPGVYPEYSALDNLLFKCRALGQNKQGYAEELLKLVELSDTGKKKARQFSLGMKQRLAIALALVGNPRLLLLDEPINGMDPQGIRDMRSLLVRIRQEMGCTIVISSHILDELAKFATSYGIIKDGRVLREFSRHQLEEENRSSIEIISPQINKVEAILRDHFHFTRLRLTDPSSLLLAEGVDRHLEISRLLFDRGIYLSQFYVRHQSLEDYFMQMTEGGIQ